MSTAASSVEASACVVTTSSVCVALSFEQAKKRDLELDPSDLKINRFDLDPRQKQKIWDAAMEASWGQVDLDEFEKDWVLYIQKYLK